MKFCNLKCGKKLKVGILLCSGDVEVIRESGERTMIKKEDVDSGTVKIPEFDDYIHEIELRFSKPTDAGIVFDYVLGAGSKRINSAYSGKQNRSG